jgi:glucose-1-phosphate adenylyltransferase
LAEACTEELINGASLRSVTFWISLDLVPTAFREGEIAQMLNSVSRIPVFILAGGVGERLAPLTEIKPKPAVTFGGTHQILDFTLSNCINSGLRNILVLTQYQRNHLHEYIRAGQLKLFEKFGWGNGDQLLPLPPASGKRYRGTADAVFQNLSFLQTSTAEHVLITSGDHVYSMDYRPLLSFHASSGAEMTIAAVRRPASEASSLGVLEVANHTVTQFVEKPAPEALSCAGDVLASMGVYAFKRRCLIDLAQSAALSQTDFGRDIVPRLIQRQGVAAYDFDGSSRNYWRDVGTLDSYFRANMDLLGSQPKFDPDVDDRWPIFSVNDSSIQKTNGSRISRRALIAGPCVIRHSVVSDGSCVERGAVIENSIILPGAHVGRSVVLRNAIVAEGVRVADRSEIGVNPALDRTRFPITPGGVVMVKAVSDRRFLPFTRPTLPQAVSAA